MGHKVSTMSPSCDNPNNAHGKRKAAAFMLAVCMLATASATSSSYPATSSCSPSSSSSRRNGVTGEKFESFSRSPQPSWRTSSSRSSLHSRTTPCCFVSASGNAASVQIFPRRRNSKVCPEPFTTDATSGRGTATIVVAPSDESCRPFPSFPLFFRPGRGSDEGSQLDKTAAVLTRSRETKKARPAPWRRHAKRAAVQLRNRRPLKEEESGSHSSSIKAAAELLLGEKPHLLQAFSSYDDTKTDEEEEESKLRRRIRRNSRKYRDQLSEEEYARRKLEWASRYTDVSTLRLQFGTNRNRLWGDFDPETTRKLYHTLLPRALLGLHEMGLMRPHELAPLAYEARMAAKKYARERCVVPGRVMAMVYDGFRSWMRYGKFDVRGMSWDQVWNKYEEQVQRELEKEIEDLYDEDKVEEELTKRTCLKILERSCITNEAVDRLFLGDEKKRKRKSPSSSCTSEGERDRMSDVKKRRKEMDIAAIAAKLEQDVHDLLLLQDDKARRKRRRLQKKAEQVKRREEAEANKRKEQVPELMIVKQ